jgi:hypothetical protein
MAKKAADRINGSNGGSPWFRSEQQLLTECERVCARSTFIVGPCTSRLSSRLGAATLSQTGLCQGIIPPDQRVSMPNAF